MNAHSIKECPLKCTLAANGLHGCCEWQEDWNVCIFVPEETTKPSDGQRAAIECGMYDVIHNLSEFDRCLMEKYDNDTF